MKERIPQISEAEWKVMRVVWSHSPVSANDVIEALNNSTDWKPKTVMTLLRRLVEKGALGYVKEGRAYLYHPLVEENHCVLEENRSFLRRVYGGALKPMLVNFIEEGELSEEEIRELKRILERKGK